MCIGCTFNAKDCFKSKSRDMTSVLIKLFLFVKHHEYVTYYIFKSLVSIFRLHV